MRNEPLLALPFSSVPCRGGPHLVEDRADNFIRLSTRDQHSSRTHFRHLGSQQQWEFSTLLWTEKSTPSSHSSLSHVSYHPPSHTSSSPGTNGNDHGTTCSGTSAQYSSYSSLGTHRTTSFQNLPHQDILSSDANSDVG